MSDHRFNRHSEEVGRDELPRSSPMTKRSPNLGRWALWATSGKLVTLAGAFGVNALLARALSPGSLGTYFFTLSIVSLSAGVAQLGLKEAVVRVSSEALARRDFAKVKGGIYGTLALGISSSILIAVVVLAGGSFLYEDMLGLTDAAPATWLVASLIVVMTGRELLGESFRGLGRIDWATLSGEGSNTVLFALALLLIVPGATALSLDLVLGISVACLVVVLLIGGTRLYRMTSEVRVPSDFPVRQLLTIGLPLMISALMAVALAEAGTAILGILASPAEVALYGASVRITGLLAMPLLIVQAVIAPLVGPLWVRRDTVGLETLLRGCATLSGAVATIGFLILLLLNDPILAIVFGDFYRQAGSVVVIMGFAQLLSVATGSCGLALSMTGHQGTMLRVTALSLTVVVVATSILTLSFGVVGTALGVCSGLVVQNIMLLAGVRRHLGVKGEIDLTFRAARKLVAKNRPLR